MRQNLLGQAKRDKGYMEVPRALVLSDPWDGKKLPHREDGN